MYPDSATPSFSTQAYPVKHVASRGMLELETLKAMRNARNIWALDRLVFDARMHALQTMIREGYQPCGAANVRIIVEVEQRAVSDEAGDVGDIPEHMHDIHVARYDASRSPWLDTYR